MHQQAQYKSKAPAVTILVTRKVLKMAIKSATMPVMEIVSNPVRKGFLQRFLIPQLKTAGPKITKEATKMASKKDTSLAITMVDLNA